MQVSEVPQEGNCTLGGLRKAVYAKDEEGKMVIVASCGSEVDETVTLQATERMQHLAEQAREKVLAGQATPLEYWMHAKRMDLLILSQCTGLWQWRIKRHFRPDIFQRLSPRVLTRYSDALGLTVEQLQKLPSE